MGFLARSASAAEWKTVAKAVSTLVEEATFEASAEGISFRAMDPSHVALIDLFWPNSAFERYECDKQFRFTVRVAEFSKLLGRADAKDSVEVSSSDEGRLTIKFSNSYTREFTINLVESTAQPTPLPKITFNAKLLMTSSTFQQILSDISVVSDHITIEASKDKVSFAGRSEQGSASATLDRRSPEVLELTLNEPSKATYSIDYLLNITKAAASNQPMTLEYSTKMPLKLEFKLGEQGGKIGFYLAPRVEEK
ncbi:MAG: proliferating cell nuclear antigen (pcna) [Nitrososphaerales archaeon]